MCELVLFQGAVSVDDRGLVGFVNDFAFEGVKRFYTVVNHRAGFVRAWHGHKREGKYVTVVKGAALVGAVKVDNWDQPSKELAPARHVLSAAKPAVLFVPPGFANGFMSLTADATIIFFSTASLEESKGDDLRFDARYWNLWDVAER